MDVSVGEYQVESALFSVKVSVKDGHAQILFSKDCNVISENKDTENKELMWSMVDERLATTHDLRVLMYLYASISNSLQDTLTDTTRTLSVQTF